MVTSLDVAVVVGAGVAVAIATWWATKKVDAGLETLTAPIKAVQDVGQGLRGVPTLTPTGAPNRVNPPALTRIQPDNRTVFSIPTKVFEPSHVVITTPNPQQGAVDNYSYQPVGGEKSGRGIRNAYTTVTETIRVGSDGGRNFIPGYRLGVSTKNLFKRVF